jgi:hypothetical protein
VPSSQRAPRWHTSWVGHSTAAVSPVVFQYTSEMTYNEALARIGKADTSQCPTHCLHHMSDGRHPSKTARRLLQTCATSPYSLFR